MIEHTSQDIQGAVAGVTALTLYLERLDALNDIIRLTEQIHKFVRNQLTWEESLVLLDEIVESEEWMQHLEMDMLIYRVGVCNIV